MLLLYRDKLIILHRRFQIYAQFDKKNIILTLFTKNYVK